MSEIASPAAPAAFDPAAYIKNANERDRARREGKTVAAPAAAAAPATETKTDPPVRLSRSERRAQNRLREELGVERGKRELLEAQLQELQKGKTAEIKPAAADADPEPKRTDFQSDAEYNRAMGRWDARQETKKELAKRDTTAANEQQLAALREEIAAADRKAEDDKKLIADWDDTAKAAQDDPEQPEFTPADHPYLMRMIATSDVKAFVLHHLAKNPKEMQKLLDLSGDLEKQAAAFRRMEGRVEKLHTKPAAKTAETKTETKTETAAERDAKKAKPSEATAATGGSAPATQVSPVLADGKTLNPAWKELQNSRAAARR